ncbi:disease resistance protein UNI [Trifolium repens]|nr:disease resistance protein UNI [Trifolium repens]
MGGVGKTTLMKELAWQVENDGSFDAVVMATIPKPPDFEQIQGQIADALAALPTPLGLKSLVPSSVLFGNLEQLMVSYCDGLENIMKSSVVNNIQKLRIFYIDGCEKIEEIIASDDENDASEIAFMKLEHLHLSNLPRLRSFCMGKHGFKFPQLQYLLVEDCPVMESFSHGVLYAPKLRAVHVNDKDEDEWHWNGDINSTIRKIVAEKGNVYKINISNHDSNVMACVLTLLLLFLVYELPEL